MATDNFCTRTTANHSRAYCNYHHIGSCCSTISSISNTLGLPFRNLGLQLQRMQQQQQQQQLLQYLKQAAYSKLSTRSKAATCTITRHLSSPITCSSASSHYPHSLPLPSILKLTNINPLADYSFCKEKPALSSSQLSSAHRPTALHLRKLQFLHTFSSNTFLKTCTFRRPT
jgi:hypothetical protein